MKRRRNSTGGSAEMTGMLKDGLSYASATRINVSEMSDSQKLNFLVEKMCVVETLTAEVKTLTENLKTAYSEIDKLQVINASQEERIWKSELKLLDLEARSRRQNLIFHNITESENETWDQCETTLVEFIKDNMKLGDAASDIVFQRVHRLGQKKVGVDRSGRPWKPRPIIAGFRDFKIKESVLSAAFNLKGSAFSVSSDYPAEIRQARGKLWRECSQARAANIAANIAYPAKLIIGGQVVRDEFPGWAMAISGRPGPGDQVPGNDPRSGGNFDIQMTSSYQSSQYPPLPQRQPMRFPPPRHNLADYLHVPQFVPRNKSHRTEHVNHDANNSNNSLSNPGTSDGTNATTDGAETFTKLINLSDDNGQMKSVAQGNQDTMPENAAGMVTGSLPETISSAIKVTIDATE